MLEMGQGTRRSLRHLAEDLVIDVWLKLDFLFDILGSAVLSGGAHAYEERNFA